MKRSTFGALAAGAVVSLLGSAALAQSEQGMEEDKACYRKECGKSIQGHEGKCGGTQVEAFTDEASCTAAGGAWTTAADAEKYKKKK